MSKERETPQIIDPFDIWRTARDSSLEAWSKIMIDFVNSETYSHATGQWLDNYLTLSQPFQHAIETTMTRVLAGVNMPARSDVTSLAERMTNIEIRLDDLDAKLDDIQRAIRDLSVAKSAVRATPEAKEAQ